jgi:hypothetical protein
MRSRFIALTLFVSFISTGCKKEEDVCRAVKNNAVVDVQSPAAGSVNQDIPINITYAILNGCGSFENIDQQINGNTVTIYARTKYEGCICTQDYHESLTVYNFRATQAGTYTLQFLKPDNTWITRTVSVQ